MTDERQLAHGDGRHLLHLALLDVQRGAALVGLDDAT